MEKRKLVYSTNSGDQRKQDPTPTKANRPLDKGPCKMRLETAGRGGKAVTVLFNLPFSESERIELLKDMQSKFGCGGSSKNDTLELRGDLRDRVEEYFGKKGLKIIRAGG